MNHYKKLWNIKK